MPMILNTRLNKKANLTVVIFTMLVLVLCIYTLFALISSSNKANQKITEHNIPEKNLLDKKEVEYRLKELTEECIVKTYKTFVERGFYLDGPIQKIEDNIVYGNKNPQLKMEFEKYLHGCMTKESKKYLTQLDIEEKQIIKELLGRVISSSQSSTKFKDNIIKIEIKDFVISNTNKNKYKTNISVEIPLERMGLLPFERFDDIINCKKNLNCLTIQSKELFNINPEDYLDPETQDKYIIYDFRSRNEFLIDKIFTYIDFKFMALEERNPIQTNPGQGNLLITS